MNRVATLAPLAALCLIATAANAQAPAKTAPPQGVFALPSLDTKFAGDLDGMIKRRLIRILAPYSKTFYFVDRGVQRWPDLRDQRDLRARPQPAAQDRQCQGARRDHPHGSERVHAGPPGGARRHRHGQSDRHTRSAAGAIGIM
jgi:hypothetical protein